MPEIATKQAEEPAQESLAGAASINNPSRQRLKHYLRHPEIVAADIALTLCIFRGIVDGYERAAYWFIGIAVVAIALLGLTRVLEILGREALSLKIAVFLALCACPIALKQYFAYFESPRFAIALAYIAVFSFGCALIFLPPPPENQETSSLHSANDSQNIKPKAKRIRVLLAALCVVGLCSFFFLPVQPFPDCEVSIGAQLTLTLHGPDTTRNRIAYALAKGYLGRDSSRIDQCKIPAGSGIYIYTLSDAIKIEDHDDNVPHEGTCDIFMEPLNAHPAVAGKLIGVGAIAVIVYPTGSPDWLSLKALRSIFSIKTPYWDRDLKRQISGAINIYTLEPNSDEWALLKYLLLESLDLKASVIGLVSNEDVIKRVSKDPNGIGFVDFAAVAHSNAVKTLAIVADEGAPVSISKTTVQNGKYPLRYGIYVHTPADQSNDRPPSFAAFAASEKGRLIISQSGFVSSPQIAHFNNQHTGTNADYLKLTANAVRLRFPFRFERKSIVLTTAAAEQIGDLAVQMVGADNARRELMVFGFADDLGSKLYNQQLALNRALIVESELERHGVTASQVWSFGSEIPETDPSDTKGRTKDRRVEIWLGARVP